MINEDSKTNDFKGLPEMAYNCVGYLMRNDDIIWRILSNPKSDCLDPNKYPDLTLEEKAGLIYRGGDNVNDYRVFLDLGQDDAWAQEVCILRVSPLAVMPDTYVHGKVVMGFQVYTHNKANHLSNYTTRTDTVIQRLISVLNGAEINSIGIIHFDRRASSLCKVITIGRIPFLGKQLTMTNIQLS